MTRTSRARAGLVLIVTAAAVATATLSTTQEKEKPKCCFTNPAYTGVCEVTPAKGETCDGILAYLNHPGATGKSYCGNTDVRGGWQQVTCKAN
jgi:hypothetical protein